jgi:hypothetical protein
VKDVFEKRSPSGSSSQSWFVSLDRRKVAATTFVQITEIVMVECSDDVWDSGRMEQSNFEELHKLRAALNAKARKEPWGSREH